VEPPDQHSRTLPWGPRSHRDHLSLWIYFPGLFAGQKDNGKAPTAHGEIAVRATPEPPRLPAKGRRIGRQALVGFQGRGCADGVQPDLCHFLFLEALIFQ
jgi:hypothetical protein